MNTTQHFGVLFDVSQYRRKNMSGNRCPCQCFSVFVYVSDSCALYQGEFNTVFDLVMALTLDFNFCFKSKSATLILCSKDCKLYHRNQNN